MILGYCCINLNLREGKPPVYTNRTLIRRTFTRERAADLALQNVKDLLTILKWNESHGIKNFRISSEVFPQHTNGDIAYCPADLPNGKHIVETIRECGRYAAAHGHVLSMHPGPFTCLASDNPEVVNKSVQEVEAHNWLAELLCADTPDLHVNINWHVGRNYGPGVADKFLAGWNRLSEATRRRSSIENDDKPNGWSLARLYDELHKPAGIRLCHDLHHALFCPSPGLNLEEEFNLAKSTWSGGWQEVHYSESADPDKLVPAHSDYLKKRLPEWLEREPLVYVEFECKAKERALLSYVSQNQS